MVEVRIPDDLWDARTIPEGVVANWFYQDGSAVSAGEKVAEIMVEKSRFEIAAEVAGTLHIRVPRDGVVRPGTVIAEIDTGG
ncbi:MAG: biotin/lipoyl-containing protein [Kiloniellaceae bacterium]